MTAVDRTDEVLDFVDENVDEMLELLDLELPEEFEDYSNLELVDCSLEALASFDASLDFFGENWLVANFVLENWVFVALLGYFGVKCE